MSVFVVHSATLALFQTVNFLHVFIIIGEKQEVFKVIV